MPKPSLNSRRSGTFLTVAFLLVASFTAFAQRVVINEVSLANIRFVDEDASLPDWLELRNAGGVDLDLAGWSLTDDRARPSRWTFTATELATGGYLKVWASDKDRVAYGQPRSLIGPGHECRYLTPTGAVSPDWITRDFDDGAWQSGPSGFGFGDGDDATVLPESADAVFLRATFRLDDPESVRELLLHMDFDDGFVAYLNGTEIGRAAMRDERPAWDARAATQGEGQIHQDRIPPVFPVPDFADLLVAGDNVLAVQVHNVEPGSSDLTALPILTAVLPAEATVGEVPTALLKQEFRYPHTNFKLSSDGETIYLFDAAGRLADSLVVPPTPPGASFGRPVGNPAAPGFFGEPTPGAANGETAATGSLSASLSFSRPEGKTEAFNLTITGAASGETIRYTLDARVPDESSPVYAGPLSITETTVVRARRFRAGVLPSPTQSRTYLVGTDHDLSIVSLVVDPPDFFSDERGIYTLGAGDPGPNPFFAGNIWKDWERPVQVSLFEPDGVAGTRFNAGVKIFGGYSRALPQRSLSFRTRAAYGDRAIDYPLFDARPDDEYQAFVLRNSGNDWMNTMLRDAALTGLFADADLETLAYRPAVTYLNGRYWGVYNLREKINEHYVAARGGVDADRVNLLEWGGDVIHGSNAGYDELIRFVQDNDLENTANYTFVRNRIDVDNFILYNIAEIYINNTDWPANNVKYWKADGGKWRWILFDTDFGFGLFDDTDADFNGLRRALRANSNGWPNQEYANALLRGLVDNEAFRHRFINHFADQINTRFLPARIREHLDTMAAVIAAEMPAHFDRWSRPLANFERKLEAMKTFGDRRPAVMKAHLLEEFDLPGYHALTVENDTPERGYVELNSLTLEERTFTGDYFETVPVNLRAVARPGFRFVRWESFSVETTAELRFSLDRARGMKAVFAAGGAALEKPVINEINYASDAAADDGDWVEIHNPNAVPLNLTGWTLKDDNDEREFRFAPGTRIGADDFLVVARAPADFRGVYPNVDLTAGELNFGLGRGGDAVRLYDTTNALADSIAYLPDAPWPTDFPDDGRTISLFNAADDNARGENWFGGRPTPGRPNQPPTGADTLENREIELRAVPNPTAGEFTIYFVLGAGTRVQGTLYDLGGRAVREVFTANLPSGPQGFFVSPGQLPGGLYTLRLTNQEGRTLGITRLVIGE